MKMTLSEKLEEESDKDLKYIRSVDKEMIRYLNENADDTNRPYYQMIAIYHKAIFQHAINLLKDPQTDEVYRCGPDYLVYRALVIYNKERCAYENIYENFLKHKNGELSHKEFYDVVKDAHTKFVEKFSI